MSRGERLQYIQVESFDIGVYSTPDHHRKRSRLF